MQLHVVTSSIMQQRTQKSNNASSGRLQKIKKKMKITLNRQLQNVTRLLTGSGRFREVPTVTL